MTRRKINDQASITTPGEGQAMTGPDHYRKAEQLAGQAHETSASAPEQRAALLAEAQVHATLAAVAALMTGHLTIGHDADALWHDALSPDGEEPATEGSAGDESQH